MKNLWKSILMFVCACVPGCGQMYQGYMKRGISLTTAACALLAVAVFLRLEPLLFFLAVIWLYSFFDTWNLRNQAEESRRAYPLEEDAYLFGLGWASGEQAARLFQRAHKLLGWALVIGGLYALLMVAADNCHGLFYWMLGPGWEEFADWLYYVIRDSVPRVAVTVGVIALGIWFIRGPKAGKAPPDYQRYTPSAPEDASAGQEDGHGE